METTSPRLAKGIVIFSSLSLQAPIQVLYPSLFNIALPPFKSL